MPEENFSAFAAMRALRDELRGEHSIRMKTIELGRPSMRSFVNLSRVQYRRQLTWLTLR